MIGNFIPEKIQEIIKREIEKYIKLKRIKYEKYI